MASEFEKKLNLHFCSSDDSVPCTSTAIFVNTPVKEIFDFPYLTDEETIHYLNQHVKLAFVIRGPPGSGKKRLTDMILDKYTNAKVYSADTYFLLFNIKRTKNNLRNSHKWCEERLEEYCRENGSIIIIKNSHGCKWELDNYLNILRRYRYTVIIGETIRKYKPDAKSLQQSNSRELSEEYYENRLLRWEELVPWFTGWFLSPVDSHWIFKKSQEILSTLFSHEDIKKLYSDIDDIKDKFYRERVIFCSASYCCAGITDEGRAAYYTEEVQENYGKAFELNITKFIIHKNMIMAAVQLTTEQYKITLNKNNVNSLPPRNKLRKPLEESMRNIKIREDYRILSTNVCDVDDENSKLTFEISSKPNFEEDRITYGLMLLGNTNDDHASMVFSGLTDPVELHFIVTLLTQVQIKKHKVGKMKMYKEGSTTIIEIKDCYRCKSIFTGLY